MSDTTQDRWGAAGGFAALAVVAAAMVFENGGPPAGASDPEVTAFYVTHARALLVQSLLFLVGAALLLWFLGCLRAFLAAAEEGTGRYSGMVFGAGVAYVALSAVAQAGQVAVARVADAAAEPRLVAAMASLSGALFVVVAVPAAVMLGAFAVVAVRVGAVPSWLGRLAAVAGVAQLGLLAGIVVTTGPFAPTGWYSFAPYALYVVWLAATAVVMARRHGDQASVARRR
jgi:hypothetical protein